MTFKSKRLSSPRLITWNSSLPESYDDSACSITAEQSEQAKTHLSPSSRLREG